jgi:hypothetical protein
VNCNYFILNVIGHQGFWFMGEIRMHLAAGGEPVTVNRRAMEPVNKVKILPVYPDCQQDVDTCKDCVLSIGLCSAFFCQ